MTLEEIALAVIKWHKDGTEGYARLPTEAECLKALHEAENINPQNQGD